MDGGDRYPLLVNSRRVGIRKVPSPMGTWPRKTPQRIIFPTFLPKIYVRLLTIYVPFTCPFTFVWYNKILDRRRRGSRFRDSPPPVSIEGEQERMKLEHRIVSTRTLRGLQEAERLQLAGWRVICVGFETLTLERKIRCCE